jgi:hypothetical protein
MKAPRWFPLITLATGLVAVLSLAFWPELPPDSLALDAIRFATPTRT